MGPHPGNGRRQSVPKAFSGMIRESSHRIHGRWRIRLWAVSEMSELTKRQIIKVGIVECTSARVIGCGCVLCDGVELAACCIRAAFCRWRSDAASTMLLGGTFCVLRSTLVSSQPDLPTAFEMIGKPLAASVSDSIVLGVEPEPTKTKSDESSENKSSSSNASLSSSNPAISFPPNRLDDRKIAFEADIRQRLLAADEKYWRFPR